MIFKEISENDFVYEFERYDRQDNFTKQGLSCLYNELNNFENDIKLDVISICCDYSEYSIEEAKCQYSDTISFNNSLNNECFINKLRDYTTVIEIDGTGRIILENF
jgi:hypothetical protein